MSSKNSSSSSSSSNSNSSNQSPPEPSIISGYEHARYAHRDTERYAYLGKEDGEPQWLDWGKKSDRQPFIIPVKQSQHSISVRRFGRQDQGVKAGLG